MGNLDGKVAIITGAGSGVGAATARLMAGRGASVVVADIAGDRAAEIAELIRSEGGAAQAVTVDVAQEAQVQAMVARTVELFGRLDILHNNAAALGPEVLGQDQDVLTMTVELWDFTMAVSLRGVMLGCKHSLPHMIGQGSGVILNTASTAGQTGDLTRPAYGAAKGGVINFTRYLATMYGRQGIRCNAIAPGLVLSPPALAQMSPEQLEISASSRLVQRAGTPDDITAMAAFLASDEAGFITGQIINVDGGVLAHFPNYADQNRARERAARLEAARTLAEPVSRLGGGFMSDRTTFQEGSALGLARLDYYVGGRAGVLGPVPSADVIDAFVWFEPAMVRSHWEAALAAVPPRILAEHWAERAHDWGRRRLTDESAAARLAALAAKVADHADPLDAPLFRGWRDLPVPTDPRSAAVHHLYALRELRGARHARALASVGVAPAEAMAVRTPGMGSMFGWADLPDPTPVIDRWRAAEDATNEAMADCLTCLSSTELEEFVATAVATEAAITW